MNSYCIMAQRITTAQRAAVDTIAKLGGISKSQAEKVYKIYRQEGVLKLDIAIGSWHVTHGAFLDKETIQHVATLDE